MRKAKILIIEDEKDIIELVQYNLEREGYTVSWRLIRVKKP